MHIRVVKKEVIFLWKLQFFCVKSVKILAGEKKWQTSDAKCEVSVLETSEFRDFGLLFEG